MARPIITLTTDFGTQDAYTAAMKGVILGINPEAVLVDISHQIPPQNIAHGAFVLGSAYRYFPPRTIHVAVVDPGVGTSREALLLATSQGVFLAPNNGILSYVLKDMGTKPREDGTFMDPMLVPVPGECAAYKLTNPRYWLPSVSSTFHGRDIFAPVAAHLSLGVSPEDTGEPFDRAIFLNILEPETDGDRLIGRVIHVDRFGNLITNIPGSALPGRDVVVEMKRRRIKGLAQSYAEGGRLVAIIGSHSYLEVSAKDGSAATSLSAGVGDRVSVWTQRSGLCP